MAKPRKVVKKEPVVEADPEPVVETLPEVEVEPEETTPSTIEEETLDARLLKYINQLGHERFNVTLACAALSVDNADLVQQAWDRLFDKGAVPYVNIR